MEKSKQRCGHICAGPNDALMAARSSSIPSSVLHPRLLIEREEVHGVLGGFEQTARDLLHVHLDNRNYLIPTSCRKFLEGHQGQHIAITTIRGKHYTRVMKVAPSEKDLLRAKVAELEAENERLRAGLKGLDDGRAGPCTQ